MQGITRQSKDGSPDLDSSDPPSYIHETLLALSINEC